MIYSYGVSLFQALEFLEANAGQFRIKPMKRLPVSGAFHTSLMQQAREDLATQMSQVKFKDPKINVHANVSGMPYRGGDSVNKVLLRQIDNPVKWEQTLHLMYERPAGEDFPRTYEVGPGKQLGVMLRRNNAKAFAHYTAVEVWRAFFSPQCRCGNV